MLRRATIMLQGATVTPQGATVTPRGATGSLGLSGRKSASAVCQWVLPAPRRLPTRHSRRQTLWWGRQATPRLRNTLCKEEGGFEHCPSRVTVSIRVCKQQPEAEAGPPPAIVNKVLLANSRAHSFSYHPWLPLRAQAELGPTETMSYTAQNMYLLSR